MRRLSIFVAMLTMAVAVMPGPVAAALPTFDGILSFPAIEGPADPEDYSWEVALGEGQELKSIDDQHAVVYYEGGEHVAFSISAEQAHDASGATVPTNLAVADGNMLTLTVHHRAGNPLMEGKSFDYPVTRGEGWVDITGGTVVVATPPDENELREILERIERANTAQLPPMPSSPPRCRVPNLTGRSLRVSRRALRNAHCTVGRVATRESRTVRAGRVVNQNPKAGTTLANGAGVSFVVARAKL